MSVNTQIARINAEVSTQTGLIDQVVAALGEKVSGFGNFTASSNGASTPLGGNTEKLRSLLEYIRNGFSKYINLVRTSIGTDRNVFNAANTPGYMNGTYASTPHYYADAACVCTGFIWLPNTVNAIYVKGATWTTSNSHCRIHIYTDASLGTNSASQTLTASNLNNQFTVETLGTDYYKFTLTASGKTNSANRWYCMSLVGTGENLIITHDEPIE